MKTDTLLSRLRRQKVRLWAEDGQLRYSAPKGVMTDEVISELKAFKKELLQKLDSADRLRRSAALSPVERTENMPLSFAQERLWFLHHLFPDHTGYNVIQGLRLTGTLHVPALEKSLQALVDRHESLRTFYPRGADNPFQVIHDHCAVSLSEHDLTGVDEKDRAAAAERLVDEEALRPFDLGKGPIIRAALYRLASEDHILLIVVHHIATDGWSRGIMLRDLSALYNAQVLRRPADLPELRVQYADFAHWQRQWLKGAVLEEQLDYWRTHLADLPTLALPTDRPRPPVQGTAGASLAFQLSKSLTDDLRILSRQADVTMAMTLLAAFQVLLAKYTGQTDIVVGSPIANRTRSELENLIGFFVNSLVMRTDLSGDPTFREALSRVNEVALGAYDHQDLPFEQLVLELQPERDFSRNPLFQVMFAFQNVPGGAPEFHGLTSGPIGTENKTTRMDLECFFEEGEDGLNGLLVFNTDLFDRSTIERIGTQYQRILAEVVTDPSRRLSDIPVLDDSQRQQLLVGWNDTDSEFPHVCVHELFESQAERTPESTAVLFEGQSLTYQELNRRSNQLAHHLQGLGVGPGKLVGILMHRSHDVLVGLLGVLKAGGAYVPLDPDYPAERLALMVSDSGLEVLITQEALVGSLPPNKAQVVCLDRDWETIAQGPIDTPVSQVSADDTAYVIYTSGSTGTPKGVEVLHRGVVNFLTTMAREPGISADDTLLSVTTLSFDIAVLELFLPLTVGAEVALVSREVAADGVRLSQAIEQSGATVMQATPATWRMLIAAGWQGSSRLRVFCGGEAFPTDLAQELLDRSAAVWNLYGPTEATIWSSIHEVTTASSSIPIGRPIANTQVYLLDHSLRPVPIGAHGELYLGGQGLARGYLNRPALTAERFVPDPFSSEPGARLYRTGDLARYLTDGTIQCLGRLDHQVKIRGYRIELEEIEATTSRHPAVAESVVVMREDEPGEQRIVAYMVLDSDRTAHMLESEIDTWADEHVSEWQEIWGQTYSDTGQPPDPTFNISGWNDSYTGEPIPAEEMREWVETTVQRIQSLGPKRILEIGCGTGLLLYRLAPECQEYRGTDFSNAALKALEKEIATRPGLENVVLEHRVANDFSGLSENSFDTVILNSVAQYLPDTGYLAQVLEGAARVLESGGRIVVGDVRSLPLLTAYHASVQLHRAEGPLSSKKLAQQIEQAQAREEELVLDPAFFSAVAKRVPRLGRVEILLKQGQADNELTRYRYDVILHVEPADRRTGPDEQELQWKDWTHEGWNLERLHAWLEAKSPESVGFTGIPNGRLQRDLKLLACLSKETPPATVDELREAIDVGGNPAMEPQAFWDAFRESPYWCELGFDGAGDEGTMVAVLRRRSSDVRPCVLARPIGSETLEGAGEQFGTHPLEAALIKTLVPQIRTHLQEHLPDYMVPSAFVTLSSLPLTPNGKVDRKALPVPEGSRTHLETVYVAPSTPYEEAMASIWADVLGLERIGIRDNFFDVGGHSLLALRIRAAMEKRFKRDIPLAILFQAPTIEQLAEMLDEGFEPSTWATLVPMRTEGDNLPFFCVPGAGNTVYSLSDLARHMGPDQPFYGLQPIGLDGDQSPDSRLEDMAAHYIEEIKDVQPEGPYLVGGQCFGSEVAFEIAQQLHAQGDEVALLALIGDNYLAPSAREGVTNTGSAYSLLHSLQRARFYIGRFPLGDIVRTTLHELNIRLNPRRKFTRRVYKAQLLARSRYVRKPYPGRALTFTASSSAPGGFSPFSLAGLVRGGVDVQRVPPAADLLIREPHVQALAENLKAYIKRVMQERSGLKSPASRSEILQVVDGQEGSDNQAAISAADSTKDPANAHEAESERQLELSLVLACHDESPHFRDNLQEIVRVLDAAELTYEIILIDDASTDGTAEQIRSYVSNHSSGNVRAFFNEIHRGRGAVLAEGLRKARAPYVGSINISLETLPQFIPAALDPLKRGAADMVFGDRKEVRPLEAPLRVAMSQGYRWLASLLLKTRSLDTASEFKFFRRDAILPVIDELNEPYPLWDTQLAVLAHSKGLRAYSVPIAYFRPGSEDSVAVIFRDSWRSFASLLALAKRHRLGNQA